MATARGLYILGAEEEGERTEFMMALSGVLEKHIALRRIVLFLRADGFSTSRIHTTSWWSSLELSGAK